MFITPLAGADPETGRLVNSFEELRPEERELAPPPYDSQEEASMAQFLTIMRHFRYILESQGAPLKGSLIHLNGWNRIPQREYNPVGKIRKSLFTDPESMPASASFLISGIRRRDALFEIGATALIPPKGPGEYRKEISLAPHGNTGFYLPAVKAGLLVFTAGEVSLDLSVPCFVNRFSDIKDEGRFLQYGRCHEEKPIMVQAWNIYQQLKSYVEHYSSSMQDVVHQTLYMLNPADYPALERIATLFYGSKLPPTTVVPCLDCSPYPEGEVEIELVAVAPE